LKQSGKVYQSKDQIRTISRFDEKIVKKFISIFGSDFKRISMLSCDERYSVAFAEIGNLYRFNSTLSKKTSNGRVESYKSLKN
jgi:hypothetical protein